MKTLTYNNMACYYRSIKKFRVALEYLEKALSIEKKGSNHKNIADIFLNISVVLSNLSKHKDALDAVINAIFLIQEELLGFCLPQSFVIALNSTLTTENDFAQKENHLSHPNTSQQNSSNVSDLRNCFPLTRLIDDRFDSGKDYERFLKERVKVLVIAYHNMGAELEHLNLFHDALLIYQKGQKIAEQFLGNQSQVTAELQAILDVIKRKLSSKNRSAYSPQPIMQNIQSPNHGKEINSQINQTIKSHTHHTESGSMHFPHADNHPNIIERKRKSIIIKTEKRSSHLGSKQRAESNLVQNKSGESLTSKSKWQISSSLRFSFQPVDRVRVNSNNNNYADFTHPNKSLNRQFSGLVLKARTRVEKQPKQSNFKHIVNNQSTHSVENNPFGLKKSNTLPDYVTPRQMFAMNQVLNQGYALPRPGHQQSNNSLSQLNKDTLLSEKINLPSFNNSYKRSHQSNNSDQHLNQMTFTSQASLNVKNITFSKPAKTESQLKNERQPPSTRKDVLLTLSDFSKNKGGPENHILENCFPGNSKHEINDDFIREKNQLLDKNYIIHIKPISTESSRDQLVVDELAANVSPKTRVKFRSSLGQKQELDSVKQEIASGQSSKDQKNLESSPLNSSGNYPDMNVETPLKDSEEGWQDEMSNLESSLSD
jgi:tetratricopeptide (TPR) repeat protein